MTTTAVTVRYFAALREVMGQAQEQVPVTGQSLAFRQLLATLEARHGAGTEAVLMAPRNRLALNQVLLSSPPDALQAGDELAFLPPVTGG